MNEQHVTLEVVAELLSAIRSHQTENFQNLNDKIDKENERFEKRMASLCNNCTKTTALKEKLNMQWFAISAIGAWLTVITGYGYVISSEVSKLIGRLQGGS